MAKKGSNRPSNRPPRPPATRWDRYQPMLERVLFVLALLGVLVTVDMNVTELSGQGCLSRVSMLFGGGGSAESTCSFALESELSTFLGVPNTVWGLLFYLAVAGLTLGVVFGGTERRALLNKARVAAIGFGFVYSMALTVYQFAVLPARCIPCLVSATLVTLLALATAYYFFSGGVSVPRGAAAPPSKAFYGGVAGVILVLILVDVSLGAFAEAPGPAVAEGQLPEVPALDIDVETQCRYDPGKPYYENINLLVGENDAVKGDPDAEVTVVEFLDPNCPHCRTTHPIMQVAAARYGDKARFVYKPVALVGRQSIPQVAALYHAAEKGKFFEMLDYQFANQSPRTGIPADALRKAGARMGLNADSLDAYLASREAADALRRESRIFRDLGLTGVPTIIVGGRVVASSARNVECIGYFIDQAAAADTSAAMTDAG